MIFQFEDFEFQTEKHSNDQIGLRVFSRVATNRAILILKLAKSTLPFIIFVILGHVEVILGHIWVSWISQLKLLGCI